MKSARNGINPPGRGQGDFPGNAQSEPCLSPMRFNMISPILFRRVASSLQTHGNGDSRCSSQI
jgi:hypothetical protein